MAKNKSIDKWLNINSSTFPKDDPNQNSKGENRTLTTLTLSFLIEKYPPPNPINVKLT